MDEFFFMNPKAFPSIFPTTVTGAMLVMTSSMSPGGDSIPMKIMNVKYDDGTNVINVFNWVVACMHCKRRGLADKCTHVPRSVIIYLCIF